MDKEMKNAVAQWTFQDKPLPNTEELKEALRRFVEIQDWCKEMNVASYAKYQTALDGRMEIARKLVCKE